MEGSSSGEEVVVVKTRKPYTITKQRERWTEEEHNRFLEALKVYGRAWQRIEEHIGTKTAVQIRSHAQKFFTKLEKEALEKGISPGQEHDIDIPPPRPKRKSDNAFPRKSGAGSLAPQETTSGKPLKSISPSTNKVMDIKGDALQEKFMMAQKLQNEVISEDRSHSEVLNIFQDTVPTSISSVNKGSSNYRKYTKFLSTEEMEDKIAINKSLNKEPSEKGKFLTGKETGIQGDCIYPHINLALGNCASTSMFQGLTSKNTVKGDQTHPKKPATHIIGRNGKSMDTEDSDDRNPTAVTGLVGDHASANPSMNPVASAIPVENVSISGSVHHPFPAFTHFTHFQSSQDAYSKRGSILWPSAEAETSLQSTAEFLAGEIPGTHMNPTPSLEAIAAVTVAAAAAWWAAQGLLPWFPPLVGFAFAPLNTTTIPSTDTAQLQGHVGTFGSPLKENQKVGNQNQVEDLKPCHHSSKSLSSSSDSYDSGRGENSSELKATRSDKVTPSVFSGFHSSDKARRKKKKDRSSCGSNTPSSSEVEMNTTEKHEKVDGEAKEAYSSNSAACKINNRRFIIGGNMNESWKEVSEEGRFAFQELFKRGVLPQSFSPPQAEEAAAAATINKGDAGIAVDLNKNASSATEPNHLNGDTKEEMCIGSNGSIGDRKLKVHQMGFKPYKRCSVEAKENKETAEAEEADKKRIRLQGEASI